MIQELDSVALTHETPEHELEEGDLGTVVHRYDSGQAFEVELLAGDGSTVAVLTLERDEIGPPGREDVFSVRWTYSDRSRRPKSGSNSAATGERIDWEGVK